MSVHVTPAEKTGGVSISVEIPLKADPHAFSLSRNHSAGDLALGTGSVAAAWYAAAACGHISTRLHGTPTAADKHRVVGLCMRVHDGNFVVAASAPKRGASISAIVKTILVECCRVPFEAFKLAAQAAGAAVPSREDHVAADHAMADGAAKATVRLCGPFQKKTAAKTSAEVAKYKGVATKGVGSAAAARPARTGKPPPLSVQKGSGVHAGMLRFPAKRLVAFALCEYFEAANFPAKIAGDHVCVPATLAGKIAALATNADKKKLYQAKLSRGQMTSLLCAANVAGLGCAGPAPTPAALAAAVFAAMR